MKTALPGELIQRANSISYGRDYLGFTQQKEIEGKKKKKKANFYTALENSFYLQHL